jgi:hypothetical protein
MSYVVFDLDETMADLSVVHPFLLSLRIKDHILEFHPYMIYFFPTALETMLDKAYEKLVERVLHAELSTDPLGILRPGLLPIMKQLAALKRKGVVKGVVIYSNNSHLPSLNFVKDIIELHVGPLICDCIHWLHPSREADKTNPYIMKSWATVARIMHEGPCRAPKNLHPKNVYFFDDQQHVDMESALNEQYYRVPAYHSFTSVDRLSEMYRSVVQDARVPLYEMLIYIVDIFQVENSTIQYNPAEATVDALINIVRKMVPALKDTPRHADYGILMMRDAMKEMKRKKRIHRYTLRGRRGTVKKRVSK